MQHLTDNEMRELIAEFMDDASLHHSDHGFHAYKMGEHLGCKVDEENVCINAVFNHSELCVLEPTTELMDWIMSV